jgi:hypothetical protein
VSLPEDDEVLEVHGMRFFYDAEEDEVWLWDNRAELWSVLPAIPPYLRIINDRLALIGVHTETHECVCAYYQVINFGCECGGI